MKKLTVIFAVVLFAFQGMAQKDPDALEKLQKVEKKGLAYKTIKSGIRYEMVNKADDTNEKVEGEITIKGQKFKLSIDNTITFCNAKDKWVYLKESNEVTLTHVVADNEMAPEERFMNNPLSVYNLYKTDFKYKIAGQEDIEGKTYVIIDLTPESLDKPYFKIRYWISESDDVYSVKYFQKDGMRISLFFTNFKADQKIADSEFTFNEADYPDVEVIDLRE